MQRPLGLGIVSLLPLTIFACGHGDGDEASQASSPIVSAPAAGTSCACTTPPSPGQCTTAMGPNPYSKYKYPLFGNLHQHTMNSLDAYSFGTRVDPMHAYEFAKGHYTIPAVGGASSAKPGPPAGPLTQPLDFLGVTDHSEWLGIVRACNDPTDYPTMYSTNDCATVRSTAERDQMTVFASMKKYWTDLCSSTSATSAECLAAQRSAWQDEQCAAACEYDPCNFTSLVAYEWTGTNGGSSIHRNVIFGTDAVPLNPLDSYTYPTVYTGNASSPGLFDELDVQCTGNCTAMAIPHNTNQSGGKQLTLPQSSGELDAMRKYQKLVEIYQHKGSSECFYDTSGAGDQDCKFEYLNPGGSGDSPGTYVRSALESGMHFAYTNGTANPLQLGIVSSVDDHNGAAGWVDEDKFVGHIGRMDDTASARLRNHSNFGPGGLAVAWAEQNTRDSIYGALSQRETYGTSGPRMIVRFYQTSTASPCTNFPTAIIDAGTAVAMGSTFDASKLAPGQPPTFAIGAWPDTVTKQPLSNGTSGIAGLAWVHVIKAHGKVGSAVVEDPPVKLASSATGQCMTWTDTKFDPAEQAFYYVRVLQTPTYRWSHFDCQTNPRAPGCEPGGELDVTITERAWTSPIWYAP